ncbi:hypothetical protein DL89DRAFT_294098 [Linderina pennispora]|uniref:Uncharacterized protein n=1 Tax=Linderina pennispora TaxID=61395 RepID=A0A1Y1W4K2_9FUNG|nr:uncharacterized protein DL89DRAFT_294096 [Linderina pennispora]XP_040741980.1 uncharacterized protein DL89DRAFT_294098 [Linderina pennispora]ORX68162.1 hypothetical protein DL89DRAFT_294096 [Linderina pennispora]ORX68166.1 hypothetical protein DL89DRAFT_294098 [Linderina pennispora]
MDTNWCVFCGKHIDSAEDALYCSETCRHGDGAAVPASASASTEYFSLASPRASPVSSPMWSPQSRSPSLKPVTSFDLSSKLPCHTPAYPVQSPSSFGPSSSLLDGIRGRSTSLPSAHLLSTV